jgi:GT2 family glycosyltransferase
MTLIQLAISSYRILRYEGPRSLIAQVIDHLSYVRKLSSAYDLYLKKNEITDLDMRRMEAEIKTFSYTPRISIITPVYNVDGTWLEKAINSVIGQVYQNWELCLVDDASTKEHVRDILAKYQEKDKRIKVKFLPENQGISGASNEALLLSAGEFVGFLDHDDELSIDALFEVIKLLQHHPDADMIYSDEDHKDIKGRRKDPYFKPDWSPDLFLSNMYTCHFGVYRKKLVEEIGGFRKGFEGSQDYDLVLRLTEKTKKRYHIPKILYHWREIPGSTSLKYQEKSYADINARKALNDALIRRKISGEVLTGKYPGFFRVKREITGNPGVSIIIPTKDQVKVLRKCIKSIIDRTDYNNYEIIVVDNNSTEPGTLEYLGSISKEPNISILKYEEPFNFSAINNFAARKAKGEYLLFLNNDTEVICSEWLSAMLEHAQRIEVGAVGCKLLYPNGKIQHVGVILGISGMRGKLGVAGHSHKNYSNSSRGYYGRPHVIHNLSAVTGACVVIRRNVFDEVGGFDENLGIAFNDVDLCLKIREKGYLIVYTPYSELYHYESLSRGYEDTPEKEARFEKESRYIRGKWGLIIDKGDPYYNPNLILEREDFTIKLYEVNTDNIYRE